MMAWDYPKKLIEMSRNPQYSEDKVGLLKLLEDNELQKKIEQGFVISAKKDVDEDKTLFIGSYGSRACGDYMTLFMLVNDDSNEVEKVSYYNYGCTSSIGATEMGAELVLNEKKFKGGVFEEKADGSIELKVTNQKILSMLKEVDEQGKTIKSVPKEKHHCSVMFEQALKNILRAYQGKTLFKDELTKEDWEFIEQEEGPLVCHCYDIHEKTITNLLGGIDEELQGMMAGGEFEKGDTGGFNDYFHRRIREMTKAGEACGKCHYDRNPSIDDIIVKNYPQYNPKSKEEKKVREYETLSFIEKVNRINKVLEEQIRPKLALEGGYVSLIGLEEDTVKIELGGSCKDCAFSDRTITFGIEETLRTNVYEKLKVEKVDLF
ncbi:MAG: NifU family protein [Nanoarchaeota archaeon]|nr:NifU family protein [Nanoarchaeota archaeon]MBU1270186.1 NifU family protein [Nanoarchaeota archaeon]MBU1604575.1 NifU family protein [Nanoarchaeota archaeon]MBU2443602.1 NifU family protein [Nanoarchaeota archaeon]